MTLRHRLHRVIYVPLDDRPVNAGRPHLLAQMVDYELITPPRTLLGSYHTAGHPDELAEWLTAQVAEPHAADCLVLSLDMLVYGGLVASRVPGLSAEEAGKRLETLARLKKLAPGTPIYASSIILRELGGNDTGETSQYQSLRHRNHQVNLWIIEELAAGNIDFLALPQDDGGPEGLHKTEQARLQERIDELGVSDRAMIYPGADEVGMTLFARFVHKHMEKEPAVKIQYIDPEAAGRVAPYEDRSFEQTIAAQVAVVGGQITEDVERADLVVLVNPPLEPDDAQRPEQIQQALADIGEIAGRRGIAICDLATANGAHDDLASALLDSDLDLAQLLAFGGWNTAANSAGSALAHSTLRLIARQDKGAFDLVHLFTSFAPMRYLQLLNSLINTERAHVQLLFLSLVDDWLYQTRLRPEIKRELHEMVEDAGSDLAELYPRVEQRLSDRLAEAAADLWMNHFWGKQCVQVGTDENPNNIVLADLEETRVRLPWRRLFEVDLEFDINLELVAEK